MQGLLPGLRLLSEDNLLQIDLAASKLGFSSSLLFRQTTCSNFNFTAIAQGNQSVIIVTAWLFVLVIN